MMLALMASWMLFILVPSAIGVFNPVELSYPTTPSTKYQGEDRNGAVASLSRICSRFGIDILKRGGNAADAVSSIVLSHHN
jgi:hypothetical protein